MDLVDYAYSFAQQKHDGQYDKAGKPYIEHPVAVSNMLDTEDEKVVALLHDIIEDTDTTPADLLSRGFTPAQVSAVVALTKRNHESYKSYLERVKNNNLACAVKLADLTHNSDLSRLNVITDVDTKRVKKYKEALSFLSQ